MPGILGCLHICNTKKKVTAGPKASVYFWSKGPWWRGTPCFVLILIAGHDILKAWSGKVLRNPTLAMPPSSTLGFLWQVFTLWIFWKFAIFPLPPWTVISAYFNKDLIHNIRTWKQPFCRYFHTVLKSKQAGGRRGRRIRMKSWLRAWSHV